MRNATCTRVPAACQCPPVRRLRCAAPMLCPRAQRPRGLNPRVNARERPTRELRGATGRPTTSRAFTFITTGRNPVCVPRESLPEVLPAPTRRSFWLELTKAPPLSSSSDRRYTTDMHSKRVPCHVSPLASTPIWRLPLCLPSSLGQNKHTRRSGS